MWTLTDTIKFWVAGKLSTRVIENGITKASHTIELHQCTKFSVLIFCIDEKLFIWSYNRLMTFYGSYEFVLIFTIY